MNHRKNLVALAILLSLITLFSAANIGPRQILPGIVPVQALQCPTGGTGTAACLTVSLDAISKPTPGGGPTLNCQTPTAPASQPGVCDILINTSANNVTTFRIGAILNATTGSPATSNINCGLTGQIACGVFGFQYAINYDPTIVT